MPSDEALTTRWARLRYRLARRLISGFPRSERSCCYDILERLELDARGPAVHADYYRQDCADALAEIRRLRRLIHALALGELESAHAK